VSESVAAVIVSYNVRELLLRCIAALREDGVDEIIVVDNQSRDGSADAVRRNDPDVAVYETGRNLGFGGGVNYGVARLSPSVTSILVVNPDVVVEPGSTKALVQLLEGQPDVGLVAPLIETPEGQLYPNARTFPNLLDATGHAFLHFVWPSNPFSRRYKMLDWDHATAADVDWVAGTHFLIRRAAWDAVGGFDEDFFMYLEDVDLCWRLRQAGWRVRYEPASRVVHDIGRSTDQTPYRMILAHHQSLYRYVSKTWTGRRRGLLPVAAAAVALRTVLAMVQRAVRGRPHAAP